MSALVTMIGSHDHRFYDKLPMITPHEQGWGGLCANNPALAKITVKRNMRPFSTHSTSSIRVTNNMIAGQLLQLCGLRFGLLQDGDVGIGVLPKGEEILIGDSGFLLIARQNVGSAQLQVHRWEETRRSGFHS
jgi:hypothetical protein